MCIQETAGEGVSVSLSHFVEDSWRENKRSHFVKCILMKEGFFVHKRKAKICKSISQAKRRRFAKVFLKKRQRFAKKYSSRKGRVLQKYLSILVFWRSNQIVSVVYKGIKKTCKFIISLFRSKIAMTKIWLLVAFTTPLLLVSGPEKGWSQGQLNGWVVCGSAALRPGFCWSWTAPESRGRSTY